MMEMIVQLVIIGMWGVVFTVHTRRLLRLAQVALLPAIRDRTERQRLSRVWWWLGRAEFWQRVQNDCVRCVLLTLMLFMFAWGFYI